MANLGAMVGKVLHFAGHSVGEPALKAIRIRHGLREGYAGQFKAAFAGQGLDCFYMHFLCAVPPPSRGGAIMCRLRRLTGGPIGRWCIAHSPTRQGGDFATRNRSSQSA